MALAKRMAEERYEHREAREHRIEGLKKLARERKLAALSAERPELIATANIGCQMHLATRAEVPIKHWIELLDR